MNKKIVVFFACLMIIAMLTSPVLAAPTKGQKTEVTINWSEWTVVEEDPVTTPGGITHNIIQGTWDIEIVINEGATYTGTAVTTRYVTVVPQGDVLLLVIKEVYDMSINCVDGGFVGSGLIVIKGWVPPTGPFELAKAHGLLHGTGVFEGQTINAGHDWVEPGPIQWTGFILKA